MNELEFFKRQLGEIAVRGNRLMLKLPSNEGREFNDALHHLIEAEKALERLIEEYKKNVFGGGS